MDHDLSVVDLFCGGGGFSEGFRQAGFEVTHAVDLDEGARQTYRMNAPEETDVLEMDLSDPDPEPFPDDVNVLLGSPPCTEFSAAKNGGNGDVQKGMELVDAFLYLVHELEPDYWVMENVPRLKDHLEDVHHLAPRPGVTGDVVDIPRRDVLNCEEFRTPQRRRRLFSGHFPDPEEPDGIPPTFGEINRGFPRPTERWGRWTKVTDPIYDLEVPAGGLSDHFYDSHFTDRERKEIEVLKEDHSFYGKMSFPDDPGDESRTVVAMNRRIARETLVMEEETPPYQSPELSIYRKPTLRELATIQGFPITYQFSGTSLSQKRQRVGDAVPPTVAFQIALGILDEEGYPIESVAPEPTVTAPSHLEFDLSAEGNSTRSRRRLSIGRSFRHHVPYDDMREFRVDLETNDDNPRHPLSEVLKVELEHPVGYHVVLYRGYSTTVESEKLPLPLALRFLEAYQEENPGERENVRRTISALQDELDGMIPDATTLQAIRSRRAERDDPLEYDILQTVSCPDSGDTGVVDRYFPRKVYEGRTIEVEFLGVTSLPVRVLLKAVAACYIAHKLNHCGRWIGRNPDEVHLDHFDVEIDREGIPSELQCNSIPPADGCIEEYFERIAGEGPGETLSQKVPDTAD